MKEIKALISGLENLKEIKELSISVSLDDDIRNGSQLNINLFFRDKEGFDCFTDFTDDSEDVDDLDMEELGKRLLQEKMYEKITDCFYWD